MYMVFSPMSSTRVNYDNLSDKANIHDRRNNADNIGSMEDLNKVWREDELVHEN